MKIVLIFYTALVLFAAGACNKLVEVATPRNTLYPETVFTDSANVKAAIKGLYAGISSTNTYNWSLTVLNGLYADEITSLNFSQYLDNALSPSEQYLGQRWTDSYASIYRANSLIEGVQSSAVLSTSLKQQAMGEALVIRAFCHFTLLNSFGHIPLITTTNVSETAMASQVPDSTVYNQIVADLKQAINWLPASYSVSGNERTRANKYVAIALLAKTYLYMEDWADAEAMATLVINDNNTFNMPDPNSVFLNTSTEAIWQWDGQSSAYTTIAGVFVPTQGITPAYILTPELLNAFEPGDLRYTDWVGTSAGYAYPAKYKITTANAGSREYYTILRLAGQYLIRAEARAHQNNITGAQEDIDVVRNRANLPGTTAADMSSLLDAIEQERRVELFCEWGNRFYDLKRTRRADAVLGAEKTGWQSTDSIFPIPSVEIGSNPNLKQNEGYN